MSSHISFCVFVCAFPPEISSFLVRVFLFLSHFFMLILHKIGTIKYTHPSILTQYNVLPVNWKEGFYTLLILNVSSPATYLQATLEEDTKMHRAGKQLYLESNNSHITYFFKGTWLAPGGWPPFLASVTRQATILYAAYKIKECCKFKAQSETSYLHTSFHIGCRRWTVQKSRARIFWRRLSFHWYFTLVLTYLVGLPYT